MDVEKIFHMKGGHDHTSYSKNSSLQKKASDMVKHITLEIIEEVYMSITPETVSIADLGCSSGPNTLSMIRDMYRTVEEACRKKSIINGSKSPDDDMLELPSVSVYLNDLPTNDFNSIFRDLPGLIDQEIVCKDQGHFRPCLFVAASPGSFYTRIFPPNFLHFIYSSYSLHWLSKVPPGINDENGKSINKGCIYISETSPLEVTKAYEQQFRDDFSKFLRLRSQELAQQGRMALIFLGRESHYHFDRGNSFLWKLLSRAFSILISKGEIEEEKLNSYDVHFYAPSKEEIEEEVSKERSLKMVGLEMFEIERKEESLNGVSYGMAVASTVRAIQESMISHHFGEHILDSLFTTYALLIDEEMSNQDIRPITFLLHLYKI